MTENETILISCTYEVVTEESAEHGDAEERGFEYENAPTEYDDVVRILKGLEPSCRPITNGALTWFTSYGDADFKTGNRTNKSYHLVRGQGDAAEALWAKAITEAGFKVLG